jgi:RNA polymerase sigma factor (sigma-70 family)
MASDGSFLALLARARQGDRKAEEELFQRYEPHVRSAVRARLRNRPHLRRLLDSQDIRQEVMVSFFKRLQAGDYEVNGEADLLGLLTTMAFNKLLGQARREGAAKRGGNKPVLRLAEEGPAAPSSDTPSKMLLKKEEAERQGKLAARIRELLARESTECQDIFRLWLDEELEWSEIASRLGGTPEGNRQKYRRARQRIRAQLDQESLAGFGELLTEEERRLIELRQQQALGWSAIAEQLGGQAADLPRKYSRALHRIRGHCGQEEVPDAWFLLG